MNVDIAPKLPPFAFSENTTLKDTTVFLDDFFEMLNLEEKVVETIAFFLSKKSALFEAISRENRTRINKQVILTDDCFETTLDSKHQRYSQHGERRYQFFGKIVGRGQAVP
jgi:hypothetical protein